MTCRKATLQKSERLRLHAELRGDCEGVLNRLAPSPPPPSHVPRFVRTARGQQCDPGLCEEGAGAGVLGSFLFQFPESLICVYSELWQDWPYVIYRKVGISGCEHTEHGGNDSPVSRTR